MGDTACTMGLKSFTSAAASGINSSGNGRIVAGSAFEEPLSVNRLKQIDKVKSKDSEVCMLIPGNAVVEHPSNGTVRHAPNDLNENSRFCMQSEEMRMNGGAPSRCAKATVRGRAGEDESSSELEDADEEISKAFRHVQVIPSHGWSPNKSQVLCYLNSATTLHFKRTGTELQVTDSSGFPLFDIWIKMNCFRQTLVLESYGRIVLLLTDNTNLFGFSTRKSEPPTITVYDWNNEVFGTFVPGDPFIIEDAKKVTIAKLINSEVTDSRTSSVWQCVHEGSGEDIASLEDCSTLRFSGNVGFQVRLLTLASAVRIATMRRAQPRSRCCCSFFSFIFNCCSCSSS